MQPALQGGNQSMRVCHLKGDRLKSGCFFTGYLNVTYLCIGIIISHYKGVSKNRGTPKWMIYNGNPY